MKREWHEVKVVRRVQWAPGLVSLVFDADLGEFRSGQFLDVAVQDADAEGARPSRSYSLASAPGEPPEIFVSLVLNGEITPTLCAAVPGDSVWLRWPPAGVFTLDRLPDARHLWLIGTGTGLSPYISMLRDEAGWQRFERVIVVHGVRAAQDLAYRAELAERAAKHPGRITVIGVVSREPDAPEVLHGRITTLYASGALESRAGASLTAADSQIMLCGNPAMVEEMRARLEEQGLTRNSPKRPGQFTVEAYW
ncbi:MAG: ferredoxin--NADP reductase [Myxococcota bacterium]